MSGQVVVLTPRGFRVRGLILLGFMIERALPPLVQAWYVDEAHVYAPYAAVPRWGQAYRYFFPFFVFRCFSLLFEWFRLVLSGRVYGSMCHFVFEVELSSFARASRPCFLELFSLLYQLSPVKRNCVR